MMTPNRRGGSLIEVMIAVVILAIGVIPVAAGLMSSATGLTTAGARAEVSELTFGQLESLRMQARTATALPATLTVGGSLTSSQLNHADTVTGASGLQVVRRWTVAAGPLTGSSEIVVRGVVLTGRFAGLRAEFGTMVPR